MMSKPDYLYIASSWRNDWQHAAVAMCRSARIPHYDFRDSKGFHWSEVDLDHDHCTFDEYIGALGKPRAQEGFARDWEALQKASHCLLILPSNRSAHLEAGWAIGQGKPTCIWVPDFDEPELMYLMADCVTNQVMELLAWLGVED